MLSAQALPVNLSVAFLDAEEAGARGSAHHVRAVPPGTLLINLDGAAKLHEAASVEAGGPAQGVPPRRQVPITVLRRSISRTSRQAP